MAPVLLRTSERMTYKRCRWQWDRAYNDMLVGRSTPAQVFGDLVHQSLAAYYRPGLKRGPHPARTFIRIYEEKVGDEVLKIRDTDEDAQEMLDLGVAVLEHYVEEYGKDRDIRIIAPEMPFAVKLVDLGGKPFFYVGRMDALAQWMETKEFGILEHKTAASITDEHLPLDEQASSYWAFVPWWIRRLQKRGLLDRRNRLPMDMILFNFLRKAKKDDRPRNDAGHFLNKDGSVSKRQPPPYFHRVPVYRDEADGKRVLYRIRSEAWEMRMAREGKVPIYKNPQWGYPDRHCEACPFRDPCELHETGSDWRGFIRASMTTENPYGEYEKDLRRELRGA